MSEISFYHTQHHGNCLLKTVLSCMRNTQEDPLQICLGLRQVQWLAIIKERQWVDMHHSRCLSTSVHSNSSALWCSAHELLLATSYTPFTRYNWLSNRLSNGFYNRLNVRMVVKRVWQSFSQPQPCWMNSHCSFNRLSNRVIQPV